VEAVERILEDGLDAPGVRPPLWDGHAGARIADIIVGWLAS